MPSISSVQELPRKKTGQFLSWVEGMSTTRLAFMGVGAYQVATATAVFWSGPCVRGPRVG
jgi:hypothetical protein